MQKQLDEIIKRYKDSNTTLESYQAISSFVDLVFKNDEFIKYTKDRGEQINIEQKKLNADKGDYSEKWNKYRDKKGKALCELDPHTPLQNLYNIHKYLKPENSIQGVDFLYTHTSPDEPLQQQDKQRYLTFLEKTYKNILPFIEDVTTITKNVPTKLKYESFDENKSILFVGDFEIPISQRNQKSNPHILLKYIINAEDDLDTQYSYWEIAEDSFDDDYNKKDSWRRYYRACKDIQEKIAIKTGITDFLIYTSGKKGSVQINKKYLK